MESIAPLQTMPPSGSPFSAEELSQHTGFLRALARGLLADETRAEDLVQDTLVVALERPPRERGSVRAWLATVARRMALNSLRGEGRRRRREESAARSELQPSHAEALDRLELSRVLSELVLELREPYRTTIYLRFYEGLGPKAIASRLSLPVKTVKTRLSRALAELRARLDERSLDHRRWNAALVAIALPPATGTSGAAAVAGWLAGGVAVKKLALAASLLAFVFLSWLGVRSGVLGSRASSSRAALPELAPASPSPHSSPVASTEPTSTEQRSPAPAPSESRLTGALIVHLTWARTGEPAGGVWLDAICASDPAPRQERFQARTADDGSARFDTLFAGKVDLIVDRGFRLEAEVAAGEMREVELEVPSGIDIVGSVVAPNGDPVGGAEIWVLGMKGSWFAWHPLASSSAHGRFQLWNLASSARFGARATGWLPSLTYERGDLPSTPNGERQARLVLGEPGGQAAGRVLDPEGRPVEGARVLIGPRGGWSVSSPRDERGEVAEYVPAVTDAAGVFQYPGEVELGLQPAYATARGFPVWSGHVEIREGERAWLEVPLAQPARIVGRVLRKDGTAVAGARVVASEEFGGGWHRDAFPPSGAKTDADGRFELDWIAPGEQELNAYVPGDARLGKVQAKVRCFAGQSSSVELTLDRGFTIRGRVVDAERRPLSGWHVFGEPFENGLVHPRQDKTDEDGSFLLANLGDCPWLLNVGAPGEFGIPARGEVPQVLPGAEDVEIVVESTVIEPARLVGRLVLPDGRPPQDVELVINRQGDNRGLFVDFDATSGDFHHEAHLPGKYSLRAIRGSKLLAESPLLELIAGQATDVGVLRIEAPGRFELTLLGVPAEEMGSLSMWLDRSIASSEPLALKDGRFCSGELAPGRWLLRCLESDLFVPQLEIEIRPGETTTLEVEARATHQVLLEFDVAHPVAKLDRVEAEVRDEAGDIVQVYRDWVPDFIGPGELRYFVLRLPRGRFHVDVSTQAGLRGSIVLDVSEATAASGPFTVALR